MCFVVVAHLARHTDPLLLSLLDKFTDMTVSQIVEETRVLPNHIFLIESETQLAIVNSVLTPSERMSEVNVIDDFFRTLAIDQGNNAAGVILSGNGNDGTAGIKHIKEQFGLVLVQDGATADYDEMPQNAIKSGCSDIVAPPGQLAIQLWDHFQFRKNVGFSLVDNESINRDSLLKVLELILNQTGIDFRTYKENTIVRRIQRRSSMVRCHDIDEYIDYLKQNSDEIETLRKELLIGVTRFFRDAEAFKMLHEQIFPALIHDKPEDYVFRVWVPACSTGEEAYSLAIILHECVVALKSHCRIQVFASDLDAQAIATARKGKYAVTAAAGIEPLWLNRYFTEVPDGQIQIKKNIRDIIVFAVQNIIVDPPFTKLDFVSCRNLLIYFKPIQQQELFPVFHYVLKPDGHLFLGSSESLGPDVTSFKVVNKKWRIFKRHDTAFRRFSLHKIQASSVENQKRTSSVIRIEEGEKNHMNNLAEVILQQSNLDPMVVIDTNYEVQYIFGRTGHILEPAEGLRNNSLLGMLRAEIKSQVLETIDEVVSHRMPIENRPIKIESEAAENYSISASFLQISDTTDSLVLLTFRKIDAAKSIYNANSKENSESTGLSISELELQLEKTRKHLQNTVEELSAANEELLSNNEEIQSTNEELQSTVEELETSKEELQSVNEEASTINNELEGRIEELSGINDDLRNLLDSTEMATLFLDLDLKIRRFTPKAVKIVPVTDADIGRPLSDLATSLDDIDLIAVCNDVLDKLGFHEHEVGSADKRVYQLRAHPYRTVANVIDGVVLSFTDITRMKRADRIKVRYDAVYRALFKGSDVAMAVIDSDNFQFLDANTLAIAKLGYSYDEFMELTIPDIEIDSSPSVTEKLMQDLLDTGKSTFLTRHISKDREIFDVSVYFKMVFDKGRRVYVANWTYL